MGVQTTLKDIQSGFLTATAHTANNTLIEEALDKALDRTGTTNNTMLVDLDMGLKNINNLANAASDKQAVNLGQLNAALVAANAAGVVPLIHARQVGDGVTKLFSTPATIAVVAQAIFVSVDGLAQRAYTDYNTTANVGEILFSEAPPLNSSIDVVVFLPNLDLSAVEFNNTWAVNTTDDIRAGNFSDKKLIEVLGRGNAKYKIDTTDLVSADDDFLVVIDSVGNRFKLVHDGTIDVRWAGAVGDNSTDNSTALQKVLDAIVSLNCAMYVPSGLYLYTTTLNVNGLVDTGMIRLFGNGGQASKLIYAPTSGTNDAIVLNLKKGAVSGYIEMESIGLSKSGAGAGRHGISLLNGKHCKFTNLYIYGFTGGAGYKNDVEDNFNGDFNRLVGCYIGACDVGAWFDCSATVNAYTDAHYLQQCQFVQNNTADIRFSNTGGLAGKANAHFVSNVWVQAKSGSAGVSIEDDVTACKFDNLAVDGALSTESYINIESTCGYNFFNNTTIDGDINDLSGLAEFVTLRRSASGKTTQRSVVTNTGYSSLTSDLSTPVAGMQWFRSDLGNMRMYDGTRTCTLPRVLTASVTYDAPSLADGTGTTTTVSISGAELGDFALASFETDLTGITVTAYVRQANQVAIRLQNESGSTLDLPSTTLRVMVFKQ